MNNDKAVNFFSILRGTRLNWKTINISVTLSR